jgi:hypothetical protein
MIKAGTWNEDYERSMLGGQTIEEWDGSLGEWKATSPMPYKDLNNRYKHLFDGMQLPYDEEASKNMPGFLVKSKNKKDMRTILESNIQDLKNDPQFQYDLNRMKDAIRSNNPTTSEADVEKNAIEALKNEIIDRNHEASGTQIEVDPYYMNNLKYNQEKEAMALRQQYAKDLEDYKTDSSIREYEQKAKIDQ